MKSLLLTLTLFAAPVLADPAIVDNVEASKSGNTWRFNVSILHPDSGWDHYADGWKIVAPDGTVLGERPLAHPHENEQPFTRSLSGVKIPAGIDHVFIHSNCSVDGQTAAPARVNLK